MAGADYNDLHKLFLQALMSRAIVSQESALQILKSLVKNLGYPGTQLAQSDVTSLVAETNVKILDFGMEIKKVTSEVTGEEFIVFVNNVDDSSVLEKINHPYNPKEREVFRLLLEAIVTNDEKYGALSSTDALNITLNNPQLSMRPGEIQAVIEKLICDKWFMEEEGDLLPAPRCVAEFEQYFRRNFHDHVQLCMLCSNVVFFGIPCNCGIISHKHCFRVFNQRRDAAEAKCPGCKETVPNAAHNGLGSSQRKRGHSRHEATPENTPGPSRGNGTGTAAQTPAILDETPGPSRPRRKRSSPA